MHAPIKLQFGTLYGRITADLSTTFGRNQMNIHGVMTNYSDKTSITRGHNLKIYKPHTTCLRRHHFYSARFINDWNGLPHDSVYVNSNNLFKTHLDRRSYPS